MQKRVKNITFINQTLGIGGAETVHRDLLTWFSKKGIKVNVYTTNRRFGRMLKGGKVNNIPFVVDLIGNLRGLVKGLILFPFAIFYYGWIVYRNKDTDLILVAGYVEKVLTFPWAYLSKIPVVWIEHGPPSRVLNKFLGIPKALYILSSEYPGYIVTPSNHTRKDLINNLRVKNNKIVVIPNGIDGSAKRRTRTATKERVCCVSRLEEGKGQDLLLMAWREVSKKVPYSTLSIVGEGETLYKLRKLARKLSIGNSVIFTGWVKDSLAEIAKSEVFVFPSSWNLEGFGVSNIEAMSCGLPVIGFNKGPLNEIVDNDCGILVEEGNTKELAKAIIKLLTISKLRKRLGKNARQKFLDNFTIDRSGKSYLEVFNKVCKTKL